MEHNGIHGGAGINVRIALRDPVRSRDYPRWMDMGNTALADALQTKDIAAMAFALRHGPTFAPHEDGTLWLHRDAGSGQLVLLLFSEARRAPASLPPATALTPAELQAALSDGSIAAVIFDVAGPHPMRAAPADLVAALQA